MAREETETLRALLRVINLGEVAADEVQRAYLLGAADTREALTEQHGADQSDATG